MLLSLDTDVPAQTMAPFLKCINHPVPPGGTPPGHPGCVKCILKPALIS